jgi:subtilisin-like proprotein convertase family protein
MISRSRCRASAIVAFGLLLFSTLAPPRAQAFDPLFAQQWHLQSRADVHGGANVIAAWPLSRGAGVVVGVVDVGVEGTHPDLAANYSAALSHDFDEGDADASPFPDEPHGTAVAGLIAAVQDNGIGVVGVAPLATIAGLRLNAESFVPDDARDAAAFLHELDRIDILNNSWGPGYFGRDGAFEPAGPGPQAQAAIEQAITLGRAGKGRIFVWSAGNRGNVGTGKDCNYNGYANSRFGIAVGAYADFGQQSWFGESCAALFVAAPSTGGTNGLTTTDITGVAGADPTDYFNDFGGSSSSAAVASGVVALMLSANPSLTWRDVQHILVRSSARVNATDPSWSTGPFPHSPRYGFGLVDAAAAVAMATSWTNVAPEQAVPEIARTVGLSIPDGNATGVSDTITIPASFAGFTVEHVEVEFDATHPVRGDLEVTLTSPAGVVSELAKPWLESQGADYRAWRFGSVHHWGESAAGAWTLTVSDPVAGNAGVWNGWKLRIYGTSASPAPLTASFTQPADGASVGGSTAVAMSAGGTNGPTTFALAVDGTTVSTQTVAGTTATFAWDTTSATNGTHTLTLTVTSNGQTATASRSVTVTNTTASAPFTVSFAYPADGASVSGTQTVGVATTATWGQPKNVELDVDGTQIFAGTITGTTLWLSWDTQATPNGTRTLRFTVTFNGASASAFRTVNVSNTTSAPAPPPPPPSTPPPAPSPLTASFTAPADGATVSATATVGMAASGGGGTSFTYQLALDGTVVSTQTVATTSASFALDTTSVANGGHTLGVTVTSNGQTATAARSITVSNAAATAPFTVSFQYPADSAVVGGSQTVGMATTATWGQPKTFVLLANGAPVTTITTTGTTAWIQWDTTATPNGLRTLQLSVTFNGATATVTRTVDVEN